MMDEYAGLSPVHRAMVQARTAHSDTTGITDGDPHFVIDTVSRKIINNSGKDTLVQYDHNSERLTFELPRYIEGHDMSNCNKVAISYLDGTAAGLYEVDDLAVKEADTEKVAFTWLISSNVTQIVGKIAFAIEFECVQEGGEITYKWHTGVNEDMRVISTITNDATVAQENADVLEKWKQELFSRKIPTKTSELENDSGFLATDGEISFGRKDGTFAGIQSVALGLDVEAFGDNSFAEGNNTVAYGDNSHAEGYQSQATGQNAHSEGENNIASGQGAHAEGGAGTTASDKYTHAEGYGTTASAQAAHSEGYNTYATGKYSHVEGYNSKATADMAHAENYGTNASGKNSHAEGLISIAKGNGSHAEGFGTVASAKYQHVQGKYNVEDTEGRYAHIVGGGSDAERRNIHTLDWDGNAEYAGDVTATVNGKKVPMSTIAGVLLQPGAATHNAIYRGECLGNTITDEQATAIAEGSFEDLFIGDYWTMGGVNYRIADFDYWYRTGFPEASRVEKHHTVIVPDTSIATGQMNGSNTTSGGYRNSLMKSKLNNTISALPPEIRSRLLVHNALLDGAWTEISVDPMNEIMVYGCYILADNSNKQTSENRQLSLFRMSPQARYAGGNYWLRNYANATEFTLVSYYGDASKDAATSTYGIRPVFAIRGE